jgi:hypothetical protein
VDAGLLKSTARSSSITSARAAFRLVPDHLLCLLVYPWGAGGTTPWSVSAGSVIPAVCRLSCDNGHAFTSKHRQEKRPHDANQLAYQIVMESAGQAEGRKEGQQGARKE